MSDAKGRCVAAPLLLLTLLTIFGSCVEEVDLSRFTSSLVDLANNSLGVKIMQDHYDSLEYTRQRRNASQIAHELTVQVSGLFETQKKALARLKVEIERVYEARDFTTNYRQCCNLQNLSSNYEFRVPVTTDYSCDRRSGIADSSARSLNGRLDTVYKRNNRAPLKWQYFGSEEGVINQFPAGRAPDCHTYDHRFRPWYIASATPNPKDVVLIVKNNLFLTSSSRKRLFEAADIILRTLNPRDRVAVVTYNEKVWKPAISGCYATSLSLATPANIRKFQKFLMTSPEPHDGNNMIKVLQMAYSYFRENSTEQNSTETTRDRAIVLFTDGERVDSTQEQEQIKQTVRDCTTKIPTPLFIFAIEENSASILAGVRTFLTHLTELTSMYPGRNTDYYIELPSDGDLRNNMANFYSRFSAKAQQTERFEPVFMVPYYDLFGLDQLVITISTPCYQNDAGSNTHTLVGVAAVDLTVMDLFAGVEYFREGGQSYAFVIDKNSLVLLHPLLPFPSSNDSAVFIDISTLEPQPGFEEVRKSMTSGGSGCMAFNTTHVLSRGYTANDGARTLVLPSNYCWRQIKGTPFSLCVVIPQRSRLQQLRMGSFPTPVDDHYHRLDVLAEEDELCQHISQTATKVYSTVALSPEAFARPDMYLLENETESDVRYIQDALTSLSDRQQKLRLGILDSVAATAKAEEIWLSQMSNTQYTAWRYIATAYGILRIYPGVHIRTKTFNPIDRPWYQRAVSHLGLLAVSPPYIDGVGTGSMITLSQAILPASATSGRGAEDPSCVVLAVMGLDLTHFHFSQLLYQAIPDCTKTDDMRCLIIDSNAYVVTHPYFIENPNNIINKHLSDLEPLVAQDMVAAKFLRKVYCNNFQYNSNFTRRPRRQYSYEVTEKVSRADGALNGGYGTNCVFYKIAPVVDTNIFFVLIDLQRTAQSLCPRITCTCNKNQLCSRLPSDCHCPCSEDLPTLNYNPCLESFENLSAPACPTRFGLNENGISQSIGISEVNVSLPLCFVPNCSQWTTQLECQSVIGCDFCGYNENNITECRLENTCPMATPTVATPTCSICEQLTPWYAVTSALLLIALIALVLAIVFAVGCLYERARLKRGHSMTVSEPTVSEPSSNASATIKLETFSDTTKESNVTQSTHVAQDTEKETFMPETNDIGGATGFMAPGSYQTTGGYSDLFTTGQGSSLNPSHAGGIWF